MTNTIILTHRDLDGIAGASLYVYCKGYRANHYKVAFIEPNDLAKMLRKYYRKRRTFVIIDIGLNNNIYNEIRYIDIDGINIEWYDHHIWDDAWIKDLRGKGINLYIDKSICASGVIAKNICTNCLGVVGEIVDIVCGADLWRFNRYESTFLFRYADLGNNNSWYINVFEMLKKHFANSINNLINHIEKDVCKYIDEELKILSSLDANIVKTNIDDITLCIYVKEQHIPSASIIGNKMLSLCDIAIIVNESLKSMSFRSRRCNVRELAKIFGGGGHARASGALINVPKVYKLLTRLGVDTVERYIINEIVRNIKEGGIDLKNLCSN